MCQQKRNKLNASNRNKLNASITFCALVKKFVRIHFTDIFSKDITHELKKVLIGSISESKYHFCYFLRFRMMLEENAIPIQMSGVTEEIIPVNTGCYI